MSSPMIRVGLANPSGRMPIEMELRSIPVLVSANSLFDHERRCFKAIPVNLQGLDVSLDSAGFVAMSRYGRYPWTIDQYVWLALFGGFTWWSSMDCCVEPEVARDRPTVLGRIMATSQMLHLCRSKRTELIAGDAVLEATCTEPMPILQGWAPDDYRISAELTNDVLGGSWPEMVGVGSVCRRQLNGEAGLWRVLHEIDRVLPANVKLHLFGVKGSALKGLSAHPRVVSVDSMAFELHARIECRKAGVSKTVAERMRILESWLGRQATGLDAQRSLELSFAS